MSASFSEALSVMNSVDVTTFAEKQEPGSSEFSVLSLDLDSWHPPDRVMGPGIHLHHPCEHPASRLTEF